MKTIARVLLTLVFGATVWLGAGCGDAAMVSVGVSDGNYYGARRLPLSYFDSYDYYDGLRYQDYVCYDDAWYYHGYDTPYASYWDDPYWW